MRTIETRVALRIFIGEDDKLGPLPLYEAIARDARHAGLAGATVTKGLLGFGRNGHVRTGQWLGPGNLPVVVEIIDTQVNIDKFLPQVEKMAPSDLITLDEVRVVLSDRA